MVLDTCFQYEIVRVQIEWNVEVGWWCDDAGIPTLRTPAHLRTPKHPRTHAPMHPPLHRPSNTHTHKVAHMDTHICTDTQTHTELLKTVCYINPLLRHQWFSSVQEVLRNHSSASANFWQIARIISSWPIFIISGLGGKGKRLSWTYGDIEFVKMSFDGQESPEDYPDYLARMAFSSKLWVCESFQELACTLVWTSFAYVMLAVPRIRFDFDGLCTIAEEHLSSNSWRHQRKLGQKCGRLVRRLLKSPENVETSPKVSRCQETSSLCQSTFVEAWLFIGRFWYIFECKFSLWYIVRCWLSVLSFFDRCWLLHLVLNKIHW